VRQFAVEDRACTVALVNSLLDAHGQIDWKSPVLSETILTETEKCFDSSNAAASSFRRFIFDLIGCTLQAMLPFGGKAPPEPWHKTRPRKVKDFFWEEPTRDEIVKAVISNVFPEDVLDNVDEIVYRQIRREEWYYDEDIAQVQFDIADAIFESTLQDVLNSVL
jgi:hypothetical protein